MRVRHILLLLAVSGILYLLFWPVPVEFVSSKMPPGPELSGVLAPNDALDKVEQLATVGEGPEDLAITHDGAIYTGTSEGNIMVLDPGAKVWRPITVTYGRPLGLAFSPDEKWLYIADAQRGLMRTDKQGHLERLIDTLNGEDLGLVDDLAVAKNGMVYFSSASTEFGINESTEAMIAHHPTGRLFRYNPATKQLDLLLDGLHFANGVALTPEEDAVLVSETGAYRIQRVQLSGKDSGRVELFAENLPGFPDGINYDEQGNLWVSLPSIRNPLLDQVLDKPYLRKMIYRLPPGLKPKPSLHTLLVALDKQGRITQSLHGPKGRFAMITNAVWKGDTVYLGSLQENSIGVHRRLR